MASRVEFSERFRASSAVAGTVGVVVGAYASYDKPGSSFVAVAGQVAVLTLVPVYALVNLNVFQLSVVSGGLMGLLCWGFHGFGADSCAKYSALVGSVTYAALTFLGPQQQESTDVDDNKDA
jgi:hypothetical protein